MADYFKIVQTTENGLKKLTVVPSGWEKKGVLYWPTTSKHSNVTDPKSKPDGTWRKFPCQLKRTGYVTYEQANDELDTMAGRSDTDDALSGNSKRRRMVKRESVFIDNFQSLMGSNNATSQTILPAPKKGKVFCQSTPMSSPQIVVLENREIVPPIHTISHADPPLVQENSSFSNTSTDYSLLDNNVISFEPEQLGMQSVDFALPNQNSDESSKFTEKIFQILEKLETKLDERITTEEKIFRSLARLETKIDALAQSSEGRPVVTMQTDVLKTIKTIDEAIALEEALKDETYFQSIVCQMKIKISKNLRSFNCCYSLVDLFFERSFFGLCSWSGQSRSKGVDKYAFKSFRRILNCFFHCVRSIDGDFTFGECESFFKDRTLKHSTQREKANSGRLSKIKHRPTGIPNRKCKKTVSISNYSKEENDNLKNNKSDTNNNDENKENEGTNYNTDNYSQSDDQSSDTDNDNETDRSDFDDD